MVVNIILLSFSSKITIVDGKKKNTIKKVFTNYCKAILGYIKKNLLSDDDAAVDISWKLVSILYDTKDKSTNCQIDLNKLQDY